MPKTSKTNRIKSGQKKSKVTQASVLKSSDTLGTAQLQTESIAQPKGMKRINYEAWRQNRMSYNARQPRLPNVLQLVKATAETLWNNKKLIAGIIAIYGLLNIILVQGLAKNADVTTFKNELSQLTAGHFAQLGSIFNSFADLIGSSGNGSSDTGGAYQAMLILIVSLALIWSLRQSFVTISVRIRDAYYRGVYPLVPFILVLVTIAAQFLPLLAGSLLYTTVINNGIAANPAEKLFFLAIFIILALVSLYLVSSSLFALYIVTLPDMEPMKALRSARELVRYRRWTVLRKVLFLPILLLVLVAVIIVPIIIFITPLAQWVFFILTMFAIAVVHGYMYTLYRELLREPKVVHV